NSPRCPRAPRAARDAGREEEGLESPVEGLAGVRRGMSGADDVGALRGNSFGHRTGLRERPLLQCGQLLSEQGVRVRRRLVEATWHSLLECLPVVRPEDAREERVDGTRFVAGAVALDRRLDEGANELRLRRGGGVGRADSMRTSVCIAAGQSRASWSAITALDEWPTMCAR